MKTKDLKEEKQKALAIARLAEAKANILNKHRVLIQKSPRGSNEYKVINLFEERNGNYSDAFKKLISGGFNLKVPDKVRPEKNDSEGK